MKTHVRARFILLLACDLLLCIANSVPCLAQQPALQITSPADGTLVIAGQTISVMVTSPAGLTFVYVAVVGPGGPVGSNTSTPVTFSLTIPTNTVPRKYALTAVGRTSGQQSQSLFAKGIQLSIERADTPASLKNDLTTLSLSSPGDFTDLRISGKFPDGTILNVTQSTYMSFASSNTAIATVNAKGMVKGVAAGRAIITATYGQGPSVGIPVSVAPGPVSPTPTSLSFGTQNIGTVSSAQAVTVTNSTNNPSLSITQVGAAGDFSEADNCVSSSPLAVGASCTINVAFAPTATGARAGSLNLQTNMMATPYGIPLSGTGSESSSGPTIASLSPTSGIVGTAVTISGSNFGSAQGTSAVSFNGALTAPTSWSSASIVVPVPSAATTGNVIVTVTGQPSNSASFIVSTPSPTLTGLSPPSGPVGTSVTIAGANFGASQGTSAVAFQGTVAAPASWSPTSITVPVPNAATSGNVYVTVAGQPSNGVNFTVTPGITALSPASGPVGTSITISGTNFGTSQGSSTVTFNGIAATPTGWTASSIVVPVPSGATTGSVVITVGGLPSNSFGFTVTGGSSGPLLLAGSSTVMSGPDNDAAGQAEAFPVAAAVTGTSSTLTIYIDSGNAATQLTAGLYADNGGQPGTLLTQGRSSSLTAGAWTTVNVSAVNVTAGSKYWLAILGTGGQINFRDGNQPGCGSQTSSQTTLTSLPASWTTGATWITCSLSGYGSGTSSAAILLGGTSLQATADSNSGGTAEAFPMMAAANGTATTLEVYVDYGNAATQLAAGLYSDNAGHPGTLLAQGTTSALTPGSWTTVSISATSVSASTNYWIAVLGTGGTLHFRDGTQSGCNSETNAQTTLTSLPASWSTGVTSNSCPLSAYGQ